MTGSVQPGKLRRIVLVRHGETTLDSSQRLIGRGDPPLSEVGRRQMRAAALRLDGEVFDLVVASPLRRSWEAARLLAGDAPVRLEADLREIDFGRWEGLSLEEIERADPVRYRAWRSGAADFEFPGGERRAAFRERVQRALARLLASPARATLLVAHKGVIRIVVEELVGTALEDGRPGLGEIVTLTRQPDDRWVFGRRSSGAPSRELAAV